jgi:hypothetical protein
MAFATHASCFPHRVSGAFPTRPPCPGLLDRMWILSPAPSPKCRRRCSVPHLLHRSRGGLSGQGRWRSPAVRATGSAQGFRPMFPRGRATASVRTAQRASRSRGPALSGSCRSLPDEPVERLVTLRSTSATHSLVFKGGARCAANGSRGRPKPPVHRRSRVPPAPQGSRAFPVRDDGAPAGASPSPQPKLRVCFSVRPCGLAGGPVTPRRTVRRHVFQGPHTVVSCAPRAPALGFSRRSARLSPGPPSDVDLRPRRQGPPGPWDPHPSDTGCRPRACCHRRVLREVGALSSCAAIETSPAARYRAPCFG